LFKRTRSSKGISPILATLLLIVIAVAAVIVTYAWVLTFTTTQTQQAGAVLSLENVRYYSSGGAKNRTDIVIRNSGTADAKIVAVYWSSTGFSALQKLTSETDYNLSPTSGIISAGSSATVTILWGSEGVTQGNWTVSTTYYYKVVTDTGQYLEFSKKSPAS
jgi:flagellin-like protein